MEHRVSKLEQDHNSLRSDIIDIKTRLAVAERDIDSINRKLDKIDANLSKLIWIVIVAVLGAVLRMAITGGF